MKDIRFNNNTLEMYDSVEEMPVTNYMQYNRFILIDAGIGSDIQSIDGHIGLIRRYLSKEDIGNADKELLNMRQSLVFVIENTSPKMFAFVALIKTLNGKTVEGLNQDAAQKIIDDLSKKGLTFGKVQGFLNHVKKKLIASLKRSSRQKRTAQN